MPPGSSRGIHRLSCDQDSEVPIGLGTPGNRVPEARERRAVIAPGEARERRMRENASVTGKENALERRRGRPRPALPERVRRAEEVRGNPKSAAGMKQGL